MNVVANPGSGSLATAVKLPVLKCGSALIPCLVPVPRNSGVSDHRCVWASGNLKSCMGDSNGQRSLRTTGLIDGFEP